MVASQRRPHIGISIGDKQLSRLLWHFQYFSITLPYQHRYSDGHFSVCCFSPNGSENRMNSVATVKLFRTNENIEKMDMVDIFRQRATGFK